MSSKVIRSSESGQAQKIAWRKVDGTAATAGPVSPSAGAGLAADPDRCRGHIAPLSAEAEAREQQARQQGFQEGEAAAAQKAAQQYQQAIQRAAQSVQDSLASRLRMRQQLEQDLVHLAIEVARRILHRELTVDPQALLGIVKAAVQKIEARELHRVRVASADTRLVETCLSGLNLPARVEVAGDPGLERGSVILETTRGALDSSVETQLQEIDRGFADIVRRQAL
jgi:flagellar assembly protein FliH